jgi:fido (protein-threonine AMPylation protein)
MAKKRDPKKRRDRYDVSGNVEAEYVDAEKTVLVNKKGIRDLETLQVAEEEALAAAYETLLGEVRMDTPMTCDLLRHIHARIFGDLYEWAGRWRTVWISKPGTTWPPPDFLDRTMGGYERDGEHPGFVGGIDLEKCLRIVDKGGPGLPFWRKGVPPCPMSRTTTRRRPGR